MAPPPPETGLMEPLRWRGLTPGEREICEEVFAGGLDASVVRLVSLPLWPRPFVPSGRFVMWPAASAYDDFVATPLWLRSLLVHELVHVWQAQGGTFLPFAKLKAGDSRASYAYDLGDGRKFSQLNIEQQAMVIQHAYLAAHGGAAPYGAPAYARFLDAWPRPLGSRPRAI